MIRHIFLSHCLLLAAWLAFGSPVQAQQSDRVPRIGYLSRGDKPTVSTPDLKAEAFVQGLRDLRYLDGKSIHLEFRYAEGKGERFPSILAELIKLKVDVLVSGTIQAIQAAKKATTTIPIVIVTQGDPVASGLIESLARPGGNITGLTRFTRELNGKRLELFKEAVPGIARLGVLGDGTGRSTAATFKEYEIVARALKIQFQSLEVRDPLHDLEPLFQAAATARANSLLTVASPMLDRSRAAIADLAIKHRLPSMNEESHWVEAGGLLSYAANDTENFRRAAVYVDKILKGAKPAELPVEQPKKFELVINLKTAKQIGVPIPPNVLARADRVIK
jgi:putative ABC transport system substrate-binding protein